MNDKLNLSKRDFRNITIVEDRNHWDASLLDLNKSEDLILCLDFGLYNSLNRDGFHVGYLDNLLTVEDARACNAQLNHFLQNWYKDENGDDLLNFNGFDIGDALLLNVLNDITYFSHFFFNIVTLKSVNYKSIVLACENNVIAEVLDYLGLSFTKVEHKLKPNLSPVYNFPILKWTEEQINSVTLKTKVRNTASKVLDTFFQISSFFSFKKQDAVFIQNYHPTIDIINALLNENKLQVILGDYIPQTNFSQTATIDLYGI